MNPNKKNIFKTYIEPLFGGIGVDDNPDDYPLTAIKISTSSSPTFPVQFFDLDNPVYFNLANPTTFSIEDFAFLENNLNFPYQGNDRYWTVKFDSSPTFYYVRINNNGIVTDTGTF